MAFSLERFRQQRLRKTRIGLYGFWGTLLFMVLDLTTAFPTAQRGGFLVVSLAALCVFAAIYVQGRRLPLEETIEIARLHGNQLKVTDLTHELNVTIATAQRILSALVARGQAIPITSPDHFAVTVYIFPELQVGEAIPSTTRDWETYHLTHSTPPLNEPTLPAPQQQPKQDLKN